MRKSLFAFISILLSTAAHAELPLTVEDLFSDKGKFKLELSSSYSNRTSRQVTSGSYVYLQTSDASFVQFHKY